MLPSLQGSKSRKLRNIMLVAVTLATGLCLYNLFIIYPSFSELLLQFTKNDAVRASHYLSATLQPDRTLSEEETLSPELTRTLKRIEISMELIGLKLYSPGGITLYSTWETDIGTKNNSEYFTSLTADGLDTARFIERDSYSLEGVKIKADVVEAYAPVVRTDGSLGGVVEVYYDISRRKGLMDRLIIHSTLVLSGLIGGMILIIILLLVREKRIVSERQRIRQAIDESREKLRTILDAIPDRILLTEKDGRLVWFNGSAGPMLAHHFPEFSQDHFADLSTLKLLPDELHASFSDAKPREAEISFTSPDGSITHFHITLSPMFLGEHLSPDTFLLIFRDVTEKKNLQAETVRAGQLASIGELATGVAHEINNPINGVINCARILQDRPDLPEPVPDIAQRIAGASDRIAMIVRSLLSFARPDPVEKETICLDTIIGDTLDLTEVQLKKDRITLRIEMEEDIPKLKVHRNQIQQVLLNLISNSRYAVKERFPEGGGEIFLSARQMRSPDNRSRIQIVCGDNGFGFPKEIRAQALTPFFTTKPVGEGTGLGLSISLSIIEQHGGSLRITSDQQWPALVIIELPVTRE